MLNVEVKSADVITKSGTSKKTGQGYSIREQEMYADLGLAYPVRIVLGLGKEQAPFAAGRYVLDKTCFRVNNFGGLEVDLRKLKPATASASRAA